MSINLFNHFLLKTGESEVNMDSFLSVDGLDYLFSGLGGLFGDYSYGYYDDYGYNDYSYYDDYDLSFSVGGLQVHLISTLVIFQVHDVVAIE